MNLSGRGVHVSCEMIVLKDDSVLMGKRGKVFGEGTWAFPGGHVEKGEKVEESMKRELMEEVGIIPTKFELLTILNDIPNIEGQDNQYFRFVFVVDNFTGNVVNKEPDKCDEWKWFKKTEIPNPIFVGHKKVVDLFLSGRRELFFQK